MCSRIAKISLTSLIGHRRVIKTEPPSKSVEPTPRSPYFPYRGVGEHNDRLDGPCIAELPRLSSRVSRIEANRRITKALSSSLSASPKTTACSFVPLSRDAGTRDLEIKERPGDQYRTLFFIALHIFNPSIATCAREQPIVRANNPIVISFK